MGLHDAVANENVRLTRENRDLRLKVRWLELENEMLLEKYAKECGRADILKDSVRRILTAFPTVFTKEQNVSV